MGTGGAAEGGVCLSLVSRTILLQSRLFYIIWGLPSRLLAVLRVWRVCSHHCMKPSCWLFVTPWNNFSSFSSSSTFLLARPLNELLYKSNTRNNKRILRMTCISNNPSLQTLRNTWGWHCLCYSSVCCPSWSGEVVGLPLLQHHPRSQCWSCVCRPKHCSSLTPS